MVSGRPAGDEASGKRRSGVLDIAAVSVLTASAAVGFVPSFAGPGLVRAAVGGAALGLAIAWVGARRTWSVVSLAAATILGYLLLGGVLALPATALAGVVPTIETVRALVFGAVTSWKALLTVAPPVDAFPELLIVPFLSTLVTAVLAGSIALRARRPGWAVLPVAVLAVGVILLGTAEPALPVVQGVVFSVVAVTWIAWRRAGSRSLLGESTRAHSTQQAGVEPIGGDIRQLRVRRVRTAAAMLAMAGAVAAASAPALVPTTHRHVLRDVVVPPLDLREYPSPLVAFRKYVKDLDEEVLFSVTGLADGARLRLATLDAYTGTVFDVAGGDPSGPTGSGSFERVGSTIPARSIDDVDAEHVDIAVEVVAYRGVWVPSIGSPAAFRFAGDRSGDVTAGLYLNAETGAALTTVGLTEGDAYSLSALLADEPEPASAEGLPFANLQLPAPQGVPTSVASTAEVYLSDASTAFERVENLRAGLASEGVFSDGLEGEPVSRAGHGADRIHTLLSGRDMVGNDEQFAVAMALMARQLGIPARVVMGFHAGEDTPRTDDGATQLRGDDAHAWVEVAFQDRNQVRWVPFDPTPDADQVPQEQDPRSSSKPEPQVLQEPPPPDEPPEPPLQPIPEAAEDEATDDEGVPWGRYVATAAMVGVPVLLLLAPFVLVVAAKSRRRRRRFTAEATVDRLSGGWREVVDLAVDLGTPVTASATRREAARELRDRYGTPSAVAVAERADAGVFGPGEPTEAETTSFWAEVDDLVEQLTRSAGRWQRIRARFSLRSLTRGRRAPVVPRGGRR